MVFLLVLFWGKNGFPFKNTAFYIGASQNGLTYSTAVIGDLANKDTDGDGIPDWEEKLYGTDPTKKETTAGIPDDEVIAKLKSEETTNGQPVVQDDSKLTKTDKFSRDLFTTIAAATQDGQQMDQSTVDSISNSLINNIQQAPQRKVYTITDLKVGKDTSVQAVTNYNLALNNIIKKYPVPNNINDIMQNFAPDENTINPAALTKLDPIISQTSKIITAMVKTPVPESFAQLHLDVINASQKLFENLNDLKLYDTDVIVALSAMSQYDQSSTNLAITVVKLKNALTAKLK